MWSRNIKLTGPNIGSSSVSETPVCATVDLLLEKQPDCEQTTNVDMMLDQRKTRMYFFSFSSTSHKHFQYTYGACINGYVVLRTTERNHMVSGSVETDAWVPSKRPWDAADGSS